MKSLPLQQTESLMDRLVEQICDRIQAGEMVQLESLIAQYPEMADRLTDIYPTLLAMSNWSQLDSTNALLASDASEQSTSQALGDFRIIRQIGRGGMGIVYEAEQLSVPRRVALKVLPLASLIQENALRRFQNEVRAAATLDHPQIVTVHSVGEERGVHYYAMQLIRGQSLAAVIRELRASADQNKLLSGEAVNQAISDIEHQEATAHVSENSEEQECPELEETAAETVAAGRSATYRQVGDQNYFRNVVLLIQQAAQALQHAHDHGIVHRDIKPGNLLLDMNGSLFVTDFGLARIETDAGVTRTGDMLGTLRYMSPEQLLANRVIIDHRTDVYSLGATLFELLTLQPLWNGDDKPELIRQISFAEPTPATRINPAVPIDLETIVLKAVSKDPADRYGGAQVFADDLQRFLDHKPVVAKRPTVVQRINKWSRRNPAVVWSTVLLLIVATIASALSAVLISNQKELATAAAAQERIAKEGERTAKERAEQRLGQLVKGNEIMTSIFKDLNINEVKDGPDPLEAVLAKRLVNAGREITGQSIGDPLMVAEMQNRLGSSLLSLGFAHEALELLKKSQQTRSELLKPDDPDLLRTLTHLAVAYLHTGDNAKAIELDEQTLERRANCFERYLNLSNLGVAYNKAGQIDRAIDMQKQALELFESQLEPEDSNRRLSVMYNLAMAYRADGQLNKALPLIKETFEIRNKKYGPGNLNTLISMNALGTMYLGVGRVDEAITLHDKTLELRKEQLSLDHPHVIESMNNLAVAYKSAGQLDKALPVLRQLVEMSHAKLGIDHPSTLLLMNNLASAIHDAGQFVKAIELHEKILEIRKTKLGLDHPDTLVSMNNLASEYKCTGQLVKALSLLEQTLHLRSEVLGYDHPSTLVSAANLANGYLAAGRLDKAVPLLEQTVSRSKSKLGPGHPNTALFMSFLATALRDAGQLDQSLMMCEQALAIYQAQLPPDHPSTLRTMRVLASIYLDKGQLDQAVSLLEQTQQKMQVKFRPESRGMLLCLADLGVAYKYAGRLDESLHLLQKVQQTANTDSVIRIGAELVDAYVKTGQEEQAAALANEVLDNVRANLPDICPEMARQLAVLSRVYFLPVELYADAEPLLRESLAIYETTTPENWRTFETQSLLGEALAGQQNFADAESCLIGSYKGLKQRESLIPPLFKDVRVSEALNRFVDLYTAWQFAEPDKGYDAKADEWQQKLSKHEAEADDNFNKSDDSTTPEPTTQNSDSNSQSASPNIKDSGLELPGTPEWLKDHNFKQEKFTFVRVRYGSEDRKPAAWSTDYPDADLNFAKQLGFVTKLDVSKPSRVLELTDATLADYPFVYLAEPGSMKLTDVEIKALREHLLGGGFLMIDDFWGESEWENLRAVMKQVFPNRKPQDLEMAHPLFHCVFDLQEKPQVMSIHAFLRGRKSERADAPSANYRSILDDKGRMMVLMCHNTDLADGWERAGADEKYLREMSIAKAFPMGINIVYYALEQKTGK